jgi:DNA invertase Pin-like site-specific DNA recombinase
VFKRGVSRPMTNARFNNSNRLRMLIGYARVSSLDQDTALQKDALTSAGVARLFEEKLSAAAKRPALEAMLYCLRRGDVVVVYKVDRLARSLAELLRVLERIESAGATFKSLTEPIETGTPLGRLLVQLLGSFAEFERNVIRERCAAGTRAALARGVRWGRPRRLDWSDAVRSRLAGEPFASIAARYGVHHTTVRLAVKQAAP